MPWTAEKVSALSTDLVRTLRANAARLGSTAVIDLCDAELSKRQRPKSSNSKIIRPDRTRVIGFHFVCQQGQGVTNNGDGTAWSGTWVVDRQHAEYAVTLAAYVALHEAKSQPSYLQGEVLDWRSAKRQRKYAEGRSTRIETGVEFLMRLTDQPYSWRGDGSGEKGYRWEGDID